MGETDIADASLEFGILGPFEATRDAVAACRLVAASNAPSSRCSSARPDTRSPSSGWSTPCGASRRRPGRSPACRPTCSTSDSCSSPTAAWITRAHPGHAAGATGSTSTPNASTPARFEDLVADGDAATGERRPGAGAEAYDKACRSGGETCWPTSRTTTSSRPSGPVWTRCVRRRSSPVSRPSSTSAPPGRRGRAGPLIDGPSATRGVPRPADPRAVSVRSAVGRLAAVPRAPLAAGRRARHRAEPAAAGAQQQSPRAGPGAGVAATVRSSCAAPPTAPSTVSHPAPTQRHRAPVAQRRSTGCRPDGSAPGRDRRAHCRAGMGGDEASMAAAPRQQAPCPPTPSASSTSPGSVLASVPVGTNPIALAAGRDAIWVINASDDTVSQVNPTTHAVQRVLDVGHDPRPWPSPATTCGSPTSPTGRCPASTSWPTGWWRPSTWAATRTRSPRDPPGSGWPTAATTPSSASTPRAAPGDPVDVGDGPDGLAVDETSVWVANGRAGSVTRIDGRTGTR